MSASVRSRRRVALRAPVRPGPGMPAVPHRRPQPSWLPPMLATLSEPAPLPAGWLYEPKLDGVRVLAFVSEGRVRLLSRNRKPLDQAYPEIAEALRQQARGEMILDGEVVAIDPATGIASFSLLQGRMQLRDASRAARSGVSVELWLFDCLFYEGRDLSGLPLQDRKLVLRDVVHFGGLIHSTPTLEGSFETLYRDACRRGAEGLIAKRAASRYSGGRSSDWLKLKCSSAQEFVVGGWTEPRGSRQGLGALLVGHYDESGALRYAGKVGTGYDRFALDQLTRLLARRTRRSSPFAAGRVPTGAAGAGVHWVTPTLVVQVGFSDWTPDGLLRHPRYLGLRDDKAAAEIGRERRAAALGRRVRA